MYICGCIIVRSYQLSFPLFVAFVVCTITTCRTHGPSHSLMIVRCQGRRSAKDEYPATLRFPPLTQSLALTAIFVLRSRREMRMNNLSGIWETNKVPYLRIVNIKYYNYNVF